MVASLIFLFLLLSISSLSPLCSAASDASEVVILTDNSFDDMTAEGSWLLEFYAPWCGHCKALSPIYEQAAEALTGKLNLGKIDCTRETRLAERFEIKGYPTLKFKRAGEVRPYSGGRTLETFIEFGESMAKHPVLYIKKAAEIRRLQPRSSGGSGLGSTAGGDSQLFIFIGLRHTKSWRLYEQMAYKLQGLYKFLSIDLNQIPQEELEEISRNLLKFPQEYLDQWKKWSSSSSSNGQEDLEEDYSIVKLLSPGIEDQTFQGPWTMGDIRQFFERNQFPLVSILEAHTFDDLTQSNQLLGFLIIDPKDSASEKYIQSLYPVARKWREKVLFAQVDGRKYSKYVSQFGINTETGLPAYVILIYPDYYYIPSPDRSVAAEEIDKFLEEIQSGQVQAVGVIPWYNPTKYFKMAEKFLGKLTEMELIIAVLCIFLVFFGLLFWLCLSGDADLDEAATAAGGAAIVGAAGKSGSGASVNAADSDEPTNIPRSAEGEARQRKSKKAE